MSDFEKVEKHAQSPSGGVLDEKSPYEAHAARHSTASDIPAGETELEQ